MADSNQPTPRNPLSNEMKEQPVLEDLLEKKLTWGKHSGLTLRQINENYPSYVRYFRYKGNLRGGPKELVEDMDWIKVLEAEDPNLRKRRKTKLENSLVQLRKHKNKTYKEAMRDTGYVKWCRNRLAADSKKASFSIFNFVDHIDQIESL